MQDPREHGRRPHDEAEAVQVTATTYVYAFPLVRAYGLLHEQVLSGRGAFAVLRPEHDEPGTRADPAVLRHGAWLDLRGGPVVLDRPPLPGGDVVSVSVVDALTHPVAELGTSSGVEGPGRWVVAGPTWDGPAVPGAPLLRAQSDVVRVTARTPLAGAADAPRVRALHEQIRFRPATGAGTGAPASPWPDWDDLDATGSGFATYLEAVLRVSRPQDAAERELVARWQTLAGSGTSAWPRTHIDALIARGAALGRARIRDAADRSLVGPFTDAVGWTDRALLARAVRALDEPFPPDPSEILSIVCPPPGADAPRGDRPRRLLLAFGRGAPPPRAWSLAAYRDPAGTDSRADTHDWLGSRTPGLHREEDGAVSVLVQHARPPGPGARANWLPAPRGPYRVVVRLYGPSPSTLRGEWIPPLLHAVD